MKNKLKNKKIILASASKRRQKILRDLGFKFKIVKSNLNEDLLIRKFKNLGPEKLVKILSLTKALCAVETCYRMSLDRNKSIAAFDTMVVCKNKILGKPKNKKDALKILLFLSNKEHKVYTGICLIDLKKKKVTIDCEETKVKMKKITRKEALNYISTKEPLDKAGAYAIQGRGKKFVKNYSGDYYNIIGLPVKKFISMLNRASPITYQLKELAYRSN